MANSIMRQEILINITPQETRVACVENGMLQEIFIERTKNISWSMPFSTQDTRVSWGVMFIRISWRIIESAIFFKCLLTVAH